jgi:ATP:corrinoid adenosyltransferase
MDELYIEIKTRYVDSGDVKKIIAKKTVIGVVTTGKISKPAKKLLDEAGIAWAENVSKEDFNKPLS